ncbi:MAG: hypothetical protein ACE5ES_00955 [Candidatus Nanoarchaeia archaeon]
MGEVSRRLEINERFISKRNRTVRNTLIGLTLLYATFWASMVCPNRVIKEIGSYSTLAGMVLSTTVGTRRVIKDAKEADYQIANTYEI